MNWRDTYQPVIGLEVHAELKTKSKMFCGCENDPFHAKQPNMYTCPVCLGMPGGLPVPNKIAIDWTLQIGMATECQINLFSKFDRKHYFYPDLAKGYQISQYDQPFCYDGILTTSAGPVKIRRIHLEEDTGKLLHTTLNGKKVTLIDFNRSGVPLVEIVTEPDITSGAQAKEYGKKLRQLLRFLDVADCDMEQGGMRLEANISLRKKGVKTLPTYKVEVKNINSFRFMEQAIEYELERQAELLEAGDTPAQETRGWDAAKNRTFSQRGKEEAADYRYFPDPDIPPIRLDKKYLQELKAALPELPETVMENLLKTAPLTLTQTEQLISRFASQVELQWLQTVVALAQQQELDVSSLANDLINKKLAVSSKQEPGQVIEAFKQQHQTTAVSENLLSDTIQEVLKTNSDAVAKYQAGQTAVLGFLMGQVLQKLPQKVDPKTIRTALESALEA